MAHNILRILSIAGLEKLPILKGLRELDIDRHVPSITISYDGWLEPLYPGNTQTADDKITMSLNACAEGTEGNRRLLLSFADCVSFP